MPDGSLKENAIYLKCHNFVWEEVGDLLTLKDKVLPIAQQSAAVVHSETVDETNL